MIIPSTYIPKVSVIVPFTVEQDMITVCLDSICGQSLSQLEIICVDNNADQGTREQVESLAATDERIVVVECKTEGSGPARNKGIQIARGKYVAFVDADDFFHDDDSIKVLYDAAESTNANLARGNVYVWSTDTDSYAALETVGQQIWFYEDKLAMYETEPLLWLPVQHQAYLFNRDFLVRHRLFYPDLLRGQDQPFLLDVLLSDAKVAVTSRPTYVYRKGHKTSDSLRSPRNYLDRMISIRMSKDTLLKRGLEKQWHLIYARMACYIERATDESPALRTAGVIEVIQEIVSELDQFGNLDYRPYDLSSAEQNLPKQHSRNQN